MVGLPQVWVYTFPQHSLHNEVRGLLKIQVSEILPHVDWSWTALHMLWRKDWNPVVSIMSQLPIFATQVLWSAGIHQGTAPGGRGDQDERLRLPPRDAWAAGQFYQISKKITQACKLIVWNLERWKSERMRFSFFFILSSVDATEILRITPHL